MRNPPRNTTKKCARLESDSQLPQIREFATVQTFSLSQLVHSQRAQRITKTKTTKKQSNTSKQRKLETSNLKATGHEDASTAHLIHKQETTKRNGERNTPVLICWDNDSSFRPIKTRVFALIKTKFRQDPFVRLNAQVLDDMSHSSDRNSQLPSLGSLSTNHWCKTSVKRFFPLFFGFAFCLSVVRWEQRLNDNASQRGRKHISPNLAIEEGSCVAKPPSQAKHQPRLCRRFTAKISPFLHI